MINSQNSKTMINELMNVLVSKSLQVADKPIFKLASGEKSNVYIDCKKTTCNAKGKMLIGNSIYDRISDLNVNAIGGLTLGADPIANAVSYASGIKGHPVNTFIVRKLAKEHGLKKTIEGDVKPGDNVIIVDDVVTTGASTIEAIEKARDFGLNVVKVIVLVDRQEGGKENIIEQGVDFEAIITKKDLLDAYHKGTDSKGTLPRESIRNNRILQSSL